MSPPSPPRAPWLHPLRRPHVCWPCWPCWPHDAYWFIDSADDLERKWPLIEEARPDLVKIFLLFGTRPDGTTDLELLTRHGVRIALGSDWFGETGRQEIDAMRTLGALSDADLLRIWSVDTPQAIFPGLAIGKLEEGYEASFPVTAEDPLASLGALDDIRLRMKQGCLLGPA